VSTPMREFRRGADGTLVVRIERRERAVLAEVVEGVVDLLATRAVAPGVTHPVDEAGRTLMPGQGVDDPAGNDNADDTAGPRASDDAWPVLQAPEDPALRRLLPDAALDPDLAAELRRLTEADLRETTAHQVGLLQAALVAGTPDVVVAITDARFVAAALTDVRLVLGERLGLRDDTDGERLYALAVAADDGAVDDDEATSRFLAAVYVVLSELQESLVERLVEDLPAPRGAVAP